MDTLFRDVRHAVRSLKRTPGFTIAVLGLLALGIGMSTAMFTVFKTVLVDRLPIAAQDRVVIMHPLDRSGRNLDVPETYLSEIARDSALFRGVTGVYHLVRPQPPAHSEMTTVSRCTRSEEPCAKRIASRDLFR